jgi:predicted ArsR family transcriptional regulator
MQDRTVDRLLYALKARGPQTAALLSKKLKITPVAVRQLLARLESAGLVHNEDRVAGVGRPKRHWRLSAAGHARFPDNYAGLTAELLESARSSASRG